MAMETNTTGLVISPIPQVKPVTQEPITQKVGDTGARSPFQQQTNVNINNSVEDMAGILAKVASTETMAENQLPQELQKMIQTMMQNSFSLDATLAQGVGSSLESQRFTLEQLNTLSRMLTQLGTMAEQGSTAPLSDSLQTLLSSLKTLDGADGKILNPVNLNKLAFQLLDSKEFSSLDPQLQQLLTSAAGMLNSSAVPAGQTSGTMTALKQLMQFFMPTPVETSEPASVPGNTAQSQQPGSGQNSTTAGGGPAQPGTSQPGTLPQTANTTGGAASSPQPGTGQPLPDPAAGKMPEGQMQPSNLPTNQAGTSQNGAKELPANAAQMQNPSGGSAGPAVTPGPQNQGGLPGQQNAAAAQAKAGLNQQLPANQQNREPSLPTGQPLPGQSAPATAANPMATRMMPQNNPANQAGMQPGQTANAGNNMMPGGAGAAPQAPAAPLQNTPQTMQVMKDLAGLLLQNTKTSEQDAMLLKNFVNGTQKMMSEQDARQLQNLIRLSEKNIPASVQQAAQKENLPDLPKLWSFVQLCDLSELKEMQSQQLKNAGKHVSDFATVLRQTMPNDNVNTENQRSMSFMMPLYVGENEKSYPTYVHVYDERKKDNETGEDAKETWLRLCLLTENIGAVEMVFRLYEKQNLNVRLAFSDAQATASFQQYIPEFKASFEASPLVLTDLKVSTIGSK
ncbi:MAG: hypothetical protein ACRC7I_07075 [Selenomonadaceae bacterium]